MNENNFVRSYAVLPDKKNSTVEPVMSSISKNNEAKGGEIEVCYSDKSCCGGSGNHLLRAIPSLRKDAGFYPPLDSDQVASARNMPFYGIGTENTIVNVRDRIVVNTYTDLICLALQGHERQNIEKVLLVDMEWATEGEYRRKAAVLTIKVATDLVTGASLTLIFHIAKLTNNFNQFSEFPKSLKLLLTDPRILKVVY
jgi:hypothetical protein